MQVTTYSKNEKSANEQTKRSAQYCVHVHSDLYSTTAVELWQ